MQDEHETRWVIAERRVDGTQWPLLIVANQREADELVELLRRRGRDAVAVVLTAEPALESRVSTT
jgi:hypothetical protein